MSSRFHHAVELSALAYSKEYSLHRESLSAKLLRLKASQNERTGKRPFMQIVVDCSNCKAKNRVDEARLANGEARCGRCGQKLEAVAGGGARSKPLGFH